MTTLEGNRRDNSCVDNEISLITKWSVLRDEADDNRRCSYLESMQTSSFPLEGLSLA